MRALNAKYYPMPDSLGMAFSCNASLGWQGSCMISMLGSVVRDHDGRIVVSSWDYTPHYESVDFVEVVLLHPSSHWNRLQLGGNSATLLTWIARQ